jgi:hypothetical protein
VQCRIVFICSGTLQKEKVVWGERQRTRDSWGAKHIRQGLAQKAWNLVQSMSRSTFQHLSIMKPFNGAFSHSIHLIVQSLSHSVIQSSTHCHSATFPICRLVLVNASYIRTEGLCCIALFMDGNGPNLLTVGLKCTLGFHQNPIHPSSQALFYGSPKWTDPSFNQAFEVFRGTGKAAMAGSQPPRKNLKMPFERLAPRKDDWRNYLRQDFGIWYLDHKIGTTEHRSKLLIIVYCISGIFRVLYLYYLEFRDFFLSWIMGIPSLAELFDLQCKYKHWSRLKLDVCRGLPIALAPGRTGRRPPGTMMGSTTEYFNIWWTYTYPI